jgi:hypothetical protein
MRKLIHINVTGLGTIQRFAGDDVEADFLEAVKETADRLQKENLHFAIVCLFENEEVNHDQFLKKFELMRH